MGKTRRIGIVELSFEALAQMLGLPDDTRIVGAIHNNAAQTRDDGKVEQVIHVFVEGGMCPETAEGEPFPRGVLRISQKSDELPATYAKASEFVTIEPL